MQSHINVFEACVLRTRLNKAYETLYQTESMVFMQEALGFKFILSFQTLMHQRNNLWCQNQPKEQKMWKCPVA